MITITENIQISDTTTSFRISVDNVDTNQTLDERYQQRQESSRSDNQQAVPEPSEPESTPER